MRKVVIVAAKRSPVGNFGGSLASIDAVTLGTRAVSASLQSIQLAASKVDEVIMGQVLQAGCGQNPARQVALAAGCEMTTPAITINKLCGSGMKSIQYAMQAIALGDADIIVAGGQENMSRAPHLLPSSRDGQRLGNWTLEDSMLRDGLTCALNDGIHMGITAENLAAKYNISRKEQDAFALASQQKAAAAQSRGYLAEEICPIAIPQFKGDPIEFTKDEFIKTNVTAESIAKPRPAFKKDGSVTAANASGINDGAAALVVMSEETADALQLQPMARVIGFATAGVDPSIMGIGPVYATRKLLDTVGWNFDDLDLIESNEAFAAQSIAVNKELGWDTSKVNINGGAIAIGHPIGASGARIVTALLYSMRRLGAKKGLATMCIGGGQGIAGAFELL